MVLAGIMEGGAGGHLGYRGETALPRMDRILSRAERAKGENTLVPPVFPSSLLPAPSIGGTFGGQGVLSLVVR